MKKKIIIILSEKDIKLFYNCHVAVIFTHSTMRYRVKNLIILYKEIIN